MDNKELIWVDKNSAVIYKSMESDIEKAKFVNKLIEQKKIDITQDIQCLDDDLLRFKAFALNYSTEFEKAYDKQADQLNKIWENCSEPVDKINKKTFQMKQEISNISKTADDLANKLKNLNTYKLERIIELINTYNGMSENDKKVFNIILDNK